MRGANGLGAGFHFFGLRASLHLAKKSCVVLKNRGHIGVIWPERFPHDGERPLVERLDPVDYLVGAIPVAGPLRGLRDLEDSKQLFN